MSSTRLSGLKEKKVRQSFRGFVVLLLAVWLGTSAWGLEVGDRPSLEGKTLAGKAFKLDSLKGKVVLVLFWATDCAVCRDKMPELRANVRGWSGKPFQLVAVSTDSRRQDVVDYERIVSYTVMPDERLTSLWMGDEAYRDTFGRQVHVPMAYLIDKAGQVVERYSGRIPAEAWDKIADLM